MFKHLLQTKSNFKKGPSAGEFLLNQSNVYLSCLQGQLNELMDARLVRTFFDLFMVILAFRNRAMGLLLSELGGYVCGFDHAPAGTKRISNLLRSKNWASSLIDDFLFERSRERLGKLQSSGKRGLLLWDDSRVEKPESWFLEGLCSVVSSKGQRLTRIKRGYYNRPSGRICVPGFQWTCVLLSNLGGVPSVCQMSWWTTRGKFKELGTNIIYRMLRKIHEQMGRSATHVFDRGYASAQMIEWLLHFQQDFIIRWKSNHLLVSDKGVKKKTHLLSRSFKARSSRLVEDKERKKTKRISIAWAPITHPEFPDNQLFLVIVRDKHNYQGPMYLITSLPVHSDAQAWEICFSYMHRWNIEQAFRFGKSELAIESPRLWFWENRLKLFAIVALVFDFLMSLMRNWPAWVRLFFNNWCHRTGNRYRNASIPIYRLRMAIANCLFCLFAQNSG